MAAVALLLAGCAQPVTVPGAATATATASSVPTAPPASAAAETAAPSVEVEELRDLQELLPSDFGGVAAHTFAVGRDMLERLAADLGVEVADVQVAFASDHGPAFIQMFAIRVTGRSAQELAGALVRTAYPAEATPEVTTVRLAGRDLTAVHDEALGPQRGTFYLLPRPEQEAVIVAQAFAQPVVEAALGELP